jgi:hypothetical protein
VAESSQPALRAGPGKDDQKEARNYYPSWSRVASYAQYVLDAGGALGLAYFLDKIAEINVLYGLVAYMTVRLGIAYYQKNKENTDKNASSPALLSWASVPGLFAFGSTASFALALNALATSPGVDVGATYWLMGSLVVFFGSLLAREAFKKQPAQNKQPGDPQTAEEASDSLLSQVSTALGFIGPIATMAYAIFLQKTNTGALASNGAYLAMAAGAVLFVKFLVKGFEDRSEARRPLEKAGQDSDASISSSNDFIIKMGLSGALFFCAFAFTFFNLGGDPSLTNALWATGAGVLSGYLFSSAYAYEKQGAAAALV